jgi:hypothetical protein
MEVRDGFIVGVFNYCDRWCEACPFTSRCRLFADMARFEAARDPNLQPVAEAPLLPQDMPPPPPPWLVELIEEANAEAAKPLTDKELRELEPKILPEHASIRVRAEAYMFGILEWRRGSQNEHTDPSDPIAVIGWFATLFPSKIYRALTGLAEDDGDREFPPDHEGSAKVAMIAIERSTSAWRELIEQRVVTDEEARPFLAELAWLLRRLEEVFPFARSFVRPGFDEPDEVANLAGDDSQ